MAEHFGKYELVRRIGAGGMAEVYSARAFGAEGFVKEVVIKRILPGLTEDEEFVEMFINEARLAAKLHHVNIVQIHDFNQVDGSYYIAMEWVDGADLRRIQTTARRRHRLLPQVFAAHIAIEALKGLHYAHGRSDRGRPLGIVHRDISPHNLLVSFAGEVKIADFGIAKVAALASATRPGRLKGKLAYMSPEQVRGDRVDHRSDLYSLGIVLWELLSGRRLFADMKSEGELIAAVQRADIPDIGEVNDSISAALATVIRRLLAASVDQRYPDAAAVLGDLGAFSGPGDPLSVAALVRELLPVEAERELRGETIESSRLAKVSGGADAQAPTRTRGQIGSSADTIEATDSPSSGSGISARNLRGDTTGPKRRENVSEAMAYAEQRDRAEHSNTLGVKHSAPRSNDRVRGASGRRHLWVSAIVALVVSTALAFVVARSTSSEQLIVSTGDLSRSTVARSAIGTITLMVKKPEIMVTLDSVPLNLSPRISGHATGGYTVRAPIGSSIDFQAVYRGRRVARRLKVKKKALFDVDALFGDETPRVTLPAPALASGSQTAPTLSDRSRPERNQGAEKRVLRRSASPARFLAEKKKAKKSSRSAELNIFVSPWANVVLDRKKIGTTPIRGFRLSRGRHVVRLSNRALSRTETVRVHAKARGKIHIRRDWLRDRSAH